MNLIKYFMFPLYPYSDSTLCTESARYSQFHATIFDFDIKSPDRDAIKRNLFQLDINTMSPALSCKAELYHVVPYQNYHQHQKTNLSTTKEQGPYSTRSDPSIN